MSSPYSMDPGGNHCWEVSGAGHPHLHQRFGSTRMQWLKHWRRVHLFLGPYRYIWSSQYNSIVIITKYRCYTVWR